MPPCDTAGQEGELAQLLRLTSDVCDRLEKWSAKPTLTAALARVHLELRVAEVRALLSSVEDHGSGASSVDVQDAIDRLRFKTAEAFGALQVCLRADLRDDYDALLDAHFYFMGGRTRGEGDRVAFARELTTILSPWFGPEATSRNFKWGLDMPESLDHEAVEAELQNHFSANLLSRAIEFEEAANAVSPRFVRKFKSSIDVPFETDPTAPSVKGTYSTVCKVTHRVTGEVLAQKTFDASHAKRKSILRELAVLEICDHPNIVTLVDAYEVDDGSRAIHLVMSPWEPLTLQWLLYTATDSSRTSTFPWLNVGDSHSDKHLFGMVMQLADAVAYLHSRFIKHKDIKPDNILLQPRGSMGVKPYLTDFGVSKIFHREAATDYTGSTWAYLSPEQLKNEESSLSSDIWQAGCCFALILALVRGGTGAVWTLHASFNRTDEVCVCNIATESTNFLNSLGDLCALGSPAQKHMHRTVTKMLERNPSSRPNIQEVKSEVQKVLKLAELR